MIIILIAQSLNQIDQAPLPNSLKCKIKPPTDTTNVCFWAIPAP